MSDELELKYAVQDAAALEALLDREFPPTGGDQWRTSRVTDRYFDTADGALEQAGYGARLRRRNGAISVTLKSEVATSAGLHHRLELEAAAVASLRPQRWPPSEVRDLVESVRGDRRLLESFVLRQRRRERQHRLAEGGACLLSIDTVRVVVGGQELAQLDQLEVELLEGDRSVLRDIARRIAASGLATPEPRSKMAIAAAIAEGRAPLVPGEPFAEAGRRVLHLHLQRMLDRAPLARDADTLALKQMRVATRRMRAVWRVFDGAYRRARQRRYVAELRQVARRLGAVRDLDVLIDGLPPDQGLELLAAAWRARRRDAFEDLLRTLDGGAYRRFVDDYVVFARTPGAGVAAGFDDIRVRDLAGGRMWQAYEQVRRHETQVAGGMAEAAALHALRIDAKRLRYTLETFRDLLPEAIASELITRLTRVQDHLGAFNDAHIAAAAAGEWLAGEGALTAPAAVAAVRAYRADREAAADQLSRSFGPAWRGVAGRSFGRQLARAIADV